MGTGATPNRSYCGGGAFAEATAINLILLPWAGRCGSISLGRGALLRAVRQRAPDSICPEISFRIQTDAQRSAAAPWPTDMPPSRARSLIRAGRRTRKGKSVRNRVRARQEPAKHGQISATRGCVSFPIPDQTKPGTPVFTHKLGVSPRKPPDTGLGVDQVETVARRQIVAGKWTARSRAGPIRCSRPVTNPPVVARLMKGFQGNLVNSMRIIRYEFSI